MTKPYRDRTDLEALGTLLLDVPNEIRPPLIAARTEAECRKSIEDQLRAQQAKQRHLEIGVPATATTGGQDAAWRDAVVEAASNNGKKGHNSEWVALKEARSKDAKKKTEAHEVALVQAKARIEVEDERVRLGRRRIPALEPLIDEERRLKRVIPLVVAAEVASGIVAAAAHTGLLSAESLSDVPGSVIVSTLFIGISVAVGLVGSTFALGRALQRRRVEILERATVPVAVAATVVAVVAVAALRATSALPEDDVGATSSVIEGVALTVLLLLSGAVIAVVAGAVLARLGKVKQELSEARVAHRLLEEGFIAAKSAHAEATQEIARVATSVAETEMLPIAFQDAVRAYSRALARDEAEVERVADRAASLWIRLSELSAAAREHVIAQINGYVVTTDRNGRVVNGVGQAGLLVLTIFAVVSSSACSSEPRPPKNWVTVCDVTGSAPQSVCSTDLLPRAFVAWSELALQRPGSTFSVVLVDHSFATTEVIFRTQVPAKFTGDVRYSRVRFRREGVARLGALTLPSDEPRGLGRSNIFAAISVAAREARDAGGETRLLLASDGLQLGDGFDFKRAIPSAANVLEQARALGLAPDLSSYSEISVCGFGTVGLSPRVAVNRDAVWRAVLEDGTREVGVRSSCRDLFPPVAKALRSARAVEP